MLRADSYRFDPARDGFGFRNPVGEVPRRTGGGSLLCRFDAFVYGKGLCFGMVTTSLLYFMGGVTGARRPPLSELPLTPGLLTVLRRRQLRQFHPRTVLAVVGDWLASGGGRARCVPGRLRLVGESTDPHVLCFGPSLGWRFFRCLARAHAVVPYRAGEGRVYVYDPNHPGDRGRFVEFRDGEFFYDGFRSSEGWGITLVPLSACPGAPNRVR